MQPEVAGKTSSQPIVPITTSVPSTNDNSASINVTPNLDINDTAEKTLASTVRIQTETGSGSGFLIEENQIVTAFHVVDQEGPILVTFNDGRQREAIVEVSDVVMDLATLALTEPIAEVPVLKLEEPENIKLGDFVLAVGSPLGLDSSISLGVISNIERNSRFQNPLQRNLIQTDAAVNPGNSGGPLVNLEGNVVGLIQLRPDVSGERLVQGVGLALRSDALKSGLRQLYEFGDISYPRLGIAGRAANIEDAVFPGVVLEEVQTDSGAFEAGLREGDTIRTVEGVTVESLEEVLTALWDYREGDVVTLTYLRGDEILFAEVTLSSFL